jgi:hypothetical protein
MALMRFSCWPNMQIRHFRRKFYRWCRMLYRHGILTGQNYALFTDRVLVESGKHKSMEPRRSRLISGTAESRCFNR